MFARARKQPAAERDWYWTASPEDRREYDAFGPWVDAVRSEADMPPRFRAAYAAHRDARFLFKVPIRAERREVRPGWDLYRQVLAVHDDRLDLLSLSAGAIATRTILWTEVGAIRTMTNLLAAEWSLLTRDGAAVTVDYNTVSARRFDALSGFVRGKLAPGGGRAAEPAGAAVTVADLFFRNMFNAARNRTPRPVVPIHFEPQGRFCRDEKNRRRLSTGLLILDATDELVIVDRGLPVRHYFFPTYAARLTFIPFAALTGFGLVAPPSASKGHFHRLTLAVDRQRIVQSCLAWPQRVVACLSERGIPQTAG